jgi:hypothetical protein
MTYNEDNVLHLFGRKSGHEHDLPPDPRYPQRRYGYQEMFELLDTQEALVRRNPAQPLMQLHAGEAAGITLALALLIRHYPE